MGLSCRPPVSSQIAAALTIATRVRGNTRAALQRKRTRMVATLSKKRPVKVAVSSAEPPFFRLNDNDFMLVPWIVLRYTQSLITIHILYPPSCPASHNLPSRSFAINISQDTLRVRCVTLTFALPHPSVIGYILSNYII